ncbi:MAG: DNA recombination protein RmuC [Verrucomicrobia bacterium]|nr:DNA recombination protein RmuC [Verrucomicrobiota bacterium]
MQTFFFLGQISLGLCIGWFFARRAFSKEVESIKSLLAKANEEKAYLQAQVNYEKEKSLLEFTCLSNKLLKENSKEFAESSQLKIEQLLSPLKQKIEVFQSNLQEIAKTGAAERLTLKNNIEAITNSNKTLAQETHLLARALKGDVKKQGTWGELVLQKILEASGLRENKEYTLQGSGLGLQDQEGRRMQPDVVIHFPDTKRVVVDSKMSYTHYDDFHNGTNESEKQESLRKLILSMKEHIKGLSEKKYQFAEGLDSPNFVLLFVPIEAIFSLVMESDPSIFEEAWKKSIIIVSPSNLLAVLRTVESVWKIEHQNRNTQKIAEEAASLYDKFVDFIKDMENVEKSLKNTTDHFEKAMTKLSSGRGNLVKKADDLKKLGLKTKKQIPSEYLDEEIVENVPL